MAGNIVLVTGASSGLGLSIAAKMQEQGNTVLRTWAHKEQSGETFGGGYVADLTDRGDVAALAEWAKQKRDEVPEGTYPILVNCAGINYIEWFQSLDWEEYERVMALNVRAGIMLTQELLGTAPGFGEETNSFFRTTGSRDQGTVLNIVSNASHMPMTNSVAYNASKGAFHIATLAMARELRKTHKLNVFGISPNKLAGTQMSSYIEGQVPGLRGWTPEEAAAYQLSALPAGEETDPDVLAEFISFLLSEPTRHKYLTNTILPYGA